MLMSIRIMNPLSKSLQTNTNVSDMICNSEVQSETEEYFEYIEIDGQQYRRKMTKRTVVEKSKSQQVVFARLRPDGSGPDLAQIDINVTTDSNSNNCSNRPTELPCDPANSIVPAQSTFKRFTEDRFRVSGSKLLRHQGDKITEKLPIKKNTDIMHLSMDPITKLLMNYMYRCGVSEYEVPIVDQSLSTQLQDSMNREWFNTQEINRPNEKSKTISYFKTTFEKNENGNNVYNITEKTKSRTLRLRHANNISPPDRVWNRDSYLLSIDSTSLDDSRCHEESDHRYNIQWPYDVIVQSSLEDEKGTSDHTHLYSLTDTNTKSKSSISEIDYSFKNDPVIDDPVIQDERFENRQNFKAGNCNYSFILKENNAIPYLIFDDDAKQGECDIAGGPVDALIVQACDGKEHLLFLGAFLHTYQSFIDPEDLINRLIIRYTFYRSKISCNANETDSTLLANENDTEKLRVGSPDDDPEKKCIHVLSLLLTIIGKLKRNLTGGIRNRIKLFENYLLENNEDNWVIAINNTINALKESMNNDNEFVQHLYELSSELPMQFKNRQSSKDSLDILDFSSREMAEQMTLLDWSKYRDVELIEVLNLKDIAKCNLPGIIEYAKHFQNVQCWTQSILLDPDKRTSEKDKYCLKFYRIMKHLRQLNNFSSYIAILLAIQLLPRKKLFSKRIRGKIEEMEDYMRPTKFAGYKDDLKKATAPCIPFLGLFYQDIVMLNIGNPQYLELNDLSADSFWTTNINNELLASLTDQCGPIINFWRSFKQYLFLKNCNKDQDKIRYSINPNSKVLKFLRFFRGQYNDISSERLTTEL